MYLKKRGNNLIDVSTPNSNSNIAPLENQNTSLHNYSEGMFLNLKGVLKKVISNISIGDSFVEDTNIESTTVGDELYEINTDLSVRYNPQTDWVQIYYNGTWNDWKQGGMQQLNLFKDGVLADGFVLTGGLSISSNLLNVYRPSSQGTAVKNYITPTIDNSNGNYTTATIEATSNSSNAAYLRVGFSDSVYADFPAYSTAYSTQIIDISSVSQIDVYGMMINSYGTGLIKKIILS